MFSHFLTISTLVGLTFAVVGEDYRPACEAVAAAMSDASQVYYPGEHEQLLWR